MRWLGKMMSLYRWNFVGSVEGMTILLDEDGKRKAGGIRACYWNLYERGDGKRRFERIGMNYGSQSALDAEAKVKAWVHGGPLPKSAPPKKTPTPPKKKPNLIAFPGGKDGAA